MYIGKAGLAGTQGIKNWFSYLHHYNPCSSHDIPAIVFQNYNSDRGYIPLTPSNVLTGVERKTRPGWSLVPKLYNWPLFHLVINWNNVFLLFTTKNLRLYRQLKTLFSFIKYLYLKMWWFQQFQGKLKVYYQKRASDTIHNLAKLLWETDST